MTVHAFIPVGCPERRSLTDQTSVSEDRRVEARRREIMALLEEIRSREPTSSEVAQVIAQECGGQLQAERLHRAAARIVATFKAK